MMCFNTFYINTTTSIHIEKIPSNDQPLPGVSNTLASLSHNGRRVILGHTLHTQTLMKTDEQKNVLSKFMILHWAAFIAILGRMRPVGPWVGHPCDTVLRGALMREFHIRTMAPLRNFRANPLIGI